MKASLWKIVIMLCVAFLGFSSAGAYSLYTPVTYTLPEKVAGVATPTLNLNGTWDFKFNDKSRWTKINVPGEAAMQGYAVEHNQPVLYRRQVVIPRDFKDKTIILRFDGTYSYASLKVNGHFVREHRGGFTRWETDITPYVKPGQRCTIELQLTDPVEEISYASGYAHHPVCGILRDVTLFALPQQHLQDLKIEATLDTATFTHGKFKISYDYPSAQPADLRLTLTAPDGSVATERTLRLTEGTHTDSLTLAHVTPWDAEHPNLYRVDLEVIDNGNIIAQASRRVGFRTIKIVGDKMMVNGRQVKLRGACRHDIHPQLGRSTTRDIDSLDAVLFKEANMNFVRTSHYPPTERFLEFCDRYGIYVECETAVCFVDTHRQRNYAPGASENDSTHTAQYLGQLAEAVKAFQSHPAVLFWSIGNESQYGSNFQKEYDWVKAYDTTRPAIFSYPGSQPADLKPVYDILSMHYQDVNGNLWQWGKQTSGFQGEGLPAVFDEWAHPACYTYQTLQTDSGIREFWGKSIDMMWNGVYNAPGALGGAIWGYVDEIFPLPVPKAGTPYWKEFAHTAKPEGFRGNCVGYGDWGIVDIWRRKKPEFWATKKGYSPVRIEADRTIAATPGMPIRMTVFNRFDHTYLSELTPLVKLNGAKVSATLSDAAPHQRGVLTVDALQWQSGDSLQVEMLAHDGSIIDSYVFVIGDRDVAFPATIASTRPLTVERTATHAIVRGDGFELPFDLSTDLITDATVGGHQVIENGPYLNAYVNYNHLTGAEVRKIADHLTIDPADWRLGSFDITKDATGTAHATVKGTYGDIALTADIAISQAGTINISYAVDGLPEGYLRETGLQFTLPDSYSTLTWERVGYWDSYPADAMSGNTGRVDLYNAHEPAYGENPNQPWADDTHDYYYWADRGANVDRPLTMAAKAMKENVFFYTLSQAPKDGASLSVVSPDASLACRTYKLNDKQLQLYVDSQWDYPEIAWGNYCKAISPNPCYGTITLQLGGE